MIEFKCTAIDPKDDGSHRVRFDPVPNGPGRIQLFTSEKEAKSFEVGKTYSVTFKQLKTKAVKEKE